MPEPHYIDVDLKQKTYLNEPLVTQNDDVTFIVRVSDDGQEFMDLNTYSTFTMASIRSDNQPVLTNSTGINGNEITFSLGSTEIAVPGRVEAAIQLYDANGRISSIPFSFMVIKDKTVGYIPSEKDQTLIELVLGQGPGILQAAIEITQEATAAEGLRETAESNRVTAETKRVNAELDRDEHENERVTNESARLESEETRKTAETARIQAEVERQTNTSTAIQNAENATTEAESATESINLVLPNVLNLEYIAPYNNTTQYLKNNIVRKDKNSYIALQNTKGNEPTGTIDSPFWGVIAIGGVDGLGSVVSVNGEMPDENGNVTLVIPDPDLTGLATKEEFEDLEEAFTIHSADYVKHPGVATTTNAGNAYAVTLNPAPGAYLNGMGLILAINKDSTAATTINVNDLGVIPIKKASGVAVTNLKANGVYTLRYNGTSFILQGEGGEYGDALINDVLAGKTIGTDEGLKTGTLALSGNAVPAQVLSGQTFYNTDVKTKLTGTIPSKAAAIISPGTSNQSLAAGQYLSGIQTILGDPDLIAINIKAGVDIFGVLGTMTSGKKSATGSVTGVLIDFQESVGTVRGLDFRPSLVVMIYQNGTTFFMTVYIGGKVIVVYNNSGSQMARFGTSTVGQYFEIYNDGFKLGSGYGGALTWTYYAFE